MTGSAARSALVGAVALGAVGALVGLVLGLLAYPPTAWFAVLEVGVPAAALGAVVGLVVGLVRRGGQYQPTDSLWPHAEHGDP